MCACSLILSTLVFVCSCIKKPFIITLQIIENSVITALKTMIILGDREEFYVATWTACMIWVQELERDTQHSKKVELAPM